MSKKVLITGANGGIGLATTKLFLEKGFDVIAHYNTSDSNLSSLDCEKMQANFENANEVAALADKIGHVDILVNNAGFYDFNEDFQAVTPKIIQKTFAINFTAPHILVQKFLPEMMKNNWGRILNISSIGVKFGGSVKSLAYSSSKSALETLTLGVAKEGAAQNVLCNALRVGVTDTSIHHQYGKDMSSRVEKIPMKRMGAPEEIAKSIWFYCSDENTFTTGSIITIAGGE